MAAAGACRPPDRRTPPPTPSPAGPKPAPPELPSDRRRAALTAAVASVKMTGAAWRSYRFGDRAWQADAWRLYDITGQLRYVANWAGNSVARCRLYVAELDSSGETVAETEDPEVAALAAGPLGTGPAKDEALRLLAVNLFVPGEGYIIAEADAGPDGTDRWWVVSGRQIKRSGGRITIRRSQLHGGGKMEYREGVDLILRCWTPHPADTDEPDSPTRSAIPDLREIEAIRKREFAELDSRLSGAGILLLSEGITFPRGDDDPPGVDGFSQLLMRAMATSLQDRASAEAMVPIVLQVAGEHLDKIKHLTFWSDLSDQLLPLREAAVKSLGQSLDIPAEVMTGLGSSNHWCVDDRTEILTDRGWRSHAELSPADTVLTLNHHTGLSEWQPVEAVNRWQVTDEPMIAMEGRGHSSLTTGNHRWPVLAGREAAGRTRRFTTTGRLAANDYLITGAPHAGLPAQAKHEDAFVELMAWYMTEGTCTRRPGRTAARVNIYQSERVNPDNVARIRNALTALYGPPVDGPLDSGGRRANTATEQRRQREAQLRAQGATVAEIARAVGVSAVQVYKDLKIIDGELAPRRRQTAPRWRITDKAGGMVVFCLNAAAGAPLTDLAPDRIVPTQFVRELTAAQLGLFLDTAVRGDGHRQAAGTPMFGQKDPRMLEAFELAGILSGRSVTSYSRDTDGFTRHTQHLISLRHHAVWRPNRASPTRPHAAARPVTYTGTIWCPTTANRTWLARRNGTVYYTGNSAWAISDDAINSQIKPLNSRIADALTTGYLRGALEEMGRDPHRYAYAFDPAALTVRPNRTADALNFHERRLISDETARVAGDFAPEDTPDGPERLRRLVEAAVVANPSLLMDPTVRAVIGLQDVAIGGGPAGGGGGGPAPAEVEQPNSPPEQQEEQPPPAAAVAAVAGLAVRRALALAGSRLVPHNRRDRYPDTPRHELHTRRGPLTRPEAEAALRGAWDDLPAAAAELNLDAGALESLLHGFCTELLVRGMGYDAGLLRTVAARAALTCPAAPASLTAAAVGR